MWLTGFEESRVIYQTGNRLYPLYACACMCVYVCVYPKCWSPYTASLLKQWAVNQIPLHPPPRCAHQGPNLESLISMSSCSQQPLPFTISSMEKAQPSWFRQLLLPYICKSCPVIMPFDIILRVFHSPSASCNKMFQAHLFHLPPTWNQPFLQEVMNPSSGK